MKIFKVIILNIIVLFIILSCDKDTPYISNDIDSILYYPNLKSLNSGENKYSSDIHWNKYTGEEALLPQPSDNEPSLVPGSKIYTVSLGDACDVLFTKHVNL